ncbi:hypothetical protein [Pseudoalteromonas sp. Q18-MNA-CIBAN-0097]|uniref:zinc ribbon domain-containing protein n=1 Tax=Pseudoalteromonas sp. Q18-MNA-CIBAN-0097 TaxID=3140440 RepID=UPI003322B731
MALVKCKECGEEVSNKAKSCPKCGAKAPKKTSLLTWLVLILIILGVYVSGQSTDRTAKPPSKVSSSEKNETIKSEKVKKVTPPKPVWVTSVSKDEMTGKFTAFAHSPISYPSKKMGFPYHDVNSWMGVGCDADNEWVYLGFNDSPNLSKDTTESGYNLLKTRIKWDDNVEDVSLTQDWGAKFLHFKDDSVVSSKIAASSSALVELQWHGEQPTYFKYSLSGSSKAISEIRGKCSKNK